MGDLVERLLGPKNRPTREVQLGNGQTITSFGLGYSDHDDKLHAEAAARIATLEAEKARLVEVVRDIAHDKLCTGALHRPSICEKSWRARALFNELGAE